MRALRSQHLPGNEEAETAKRVGTFLFTSSLGREHHIIYPAIHMKYPTPELMSIWSPASQTIFFFRMDGTAERNSLTPVWTSLEWYQTNVPVSSPWPMQFHD